MKCTTEFKINDKGRMNAYVVRSFITVLIAAIASGGDVNNFTFGDCEPGKETCRDCYLTLAKSLLGNGANVFNLTTVFFSPILNPPDSVIVTYHFRNQSVHTQSLWFWANSFGYFLHPMQYFQFASLLFGKPEPLFEQTVEVTLDATECLGVSDEFLQLLTQRVSQTLPDLTYF